MVFNLTTHAFFPYIDHTKAIRCYKNEGPCFGTGELALGKGPFNEENAFWSLLNYSGYHIPVSSENVSMLTN